MRREIRFTLNGAPVALSDADPRTTLLDWLREGRRLTGTKEGCNEGDCGACTVSVQRPGGPRRAVNACIQLLPMLDGAAVTTVEGIEGPGGAPHPVQAAMTELHGSQCGFCTPGIVMSLWAAHPDGVRDDLADVLAGNLCRCTGYGPILAAGRAAAEREAPWEGAPAFPADDGLMVKVTGGGAVGWIPRSEDELTALTAAHPDAVMVAGATDVGLWITKRLDEPETLIFLNRISGFDRVVETPHAVELGAGASYAQAHAALARLSPDFGELVRRIGSVQVRASGAIGGNVANGSPIGDTPPPMIALGAEVVLRSTAGERRMPLEDFFLDYGRQDRRRDEHVSAIRIPRPADPADLSVHKISKRFDQDISAVLGAFHIRVEDGRVAHARIAFGGMAATPRRARAVEAALEGRPWSEETVETALPAFAEDFSPINDMRASAEYRLQVARNLLRKVWAERTDGPQRLAGPGLRLEAAE